MKITWPLFWCLSPESQALLMNYQYDTYETKMDIPPDRVDGVQVKTSPDIPEEFDRVMRKKPRPGGAGWRGR